MRTLLLNQGLSLLNQQAARGDKLYLLGFRTGTRPATRAEMDSWDNNEIPLATMQGQVFFEADHNNIGYTPTLEDEIKLIFYVPESVAERALSNLTILAGFGSGFDAARPFAFAATDAGTIKLQTTPISPGMGYSFNLLFAIQGLLDRFDLSNLTLKTPEWLRVPDEQRLPLPYSDGHDQFIIGTHTRWGGAHPVINAQNRHYGCPLVEAFDSRAPHVFGIEGGKSGDGYRLDGAN